jgi:hypothetical protein
MTAGKKWATVFFAVVLSLGLGKWYYSRLQHGNVKKIYSYNPWQAGYAKSCLLLTGFSPTEGGPAGQNGKGTIHCMDLDSTDSTEKFLVVAEVSLDAASQKAFGDTRHWGVRMLCTKKAENVSCIYDGK